MTNVPDNIREFWTDLYKLFDKHYNMDIKSPDAWNTFWDDVVKLYEKHGKKAGMANLLNDVADLLIECKDQPK